VGVAQHGRRCTIHHFRAAHGTGAQGNAGLTVRWS
jgi:hypothetical protein